MACNLTPFLSPAPPSTRHSPHDVCFLAFADPSSSIDIIDREIDIIDREIGFQILLLLLFTIQAHPMLCCIAKAVFNAQCAIIIPALRWMFYVSPFKFASAPSQTLTSQYTTRSENDRPVRHATYCSTQPIMLPFTKKLGPWIHLVALATLVASLCVLVWRNARQWAMCDVGTCNPRESPVSQGTNKLLWKGNLPFRGVT